MTRTLTESCREQIESQEKILQVARNDFTLTKQRLIAMLENSARPTHELLVSLREMQGQILDQTIVMTAAVSKLTTLHEITVEHTG